MYFSTGLTVATLLASTAMAVPLAGHQRHQQLHKARQSSGTFNIAVTNNCAVSQSVGLFQITPSFSMLSMSTPVELATGGSTTIQAPFTALGMRLSGTASGGTAAQWNPQALFEFGYSSFGGTDGTAYNLSVMEGAPADIGIAVTPSNSACESKSCSPSTCALDQGWTNPGQTANGSPADTVCYHGMTDFAVTFCP